MTSTFHLDTIRSDQPSGANVLCIHGLFAGSWVFEGLLPLLARRFFGLSYVAAFWTAYVLTRPLGASFADWMGGPTFRGGLGIPTALVAVMWTVGIAAVAAYLVVSHRNRAPQVAIPGDARTAVVVREG